MHPPFRSGPGTAGSPSTISTCFRKGIAPRRKQGHGLVSKRRCGSAVLNGIVAVPNMAMMMLIVSNGTIGRGSSR
ncbi:hypothetical protein ABIA96_004092 [Bradyrhizobium sp. LB11.1]